MKFVLTKNSQVILGPVEWSSRFFENHLSRVGMSVTLPLTLTASFTVAPGISILPATLVEPSYNSKIQQLAGPFWSLTATTATGTYTVVDKNVESVKNDLLAQVAADRYEKEIAGTTIVLQGVTVTLDTTRENRNVIAQQYLLLPEGQTAHWKFKEARENRNVIAQQYLLLPEGQTAHWKFKEAWLNLSKAEFAQAVSAGVAHIQAQFDVERAKVAEISASSTLSQLDAVVMPARNTDSRPALV